MVNSKKMLGMVIGLFCLTFVVVSAMAAPVEIKLGHVDPRTFVFPKRGQRERRLRASLKAQPGAMWT